jgi:hypothetical protein
MMSVIRLSVGVLRQVDYLDVGVLNCNENDGWPKLFLPVTDASGNLPTNHTNKKYQDAPKKSRQRLIIKNSTWRRRWCTNLSNASQNHARRVTKLWPA